MNNNLLDTSKIFDAKIRLQMIASLYVNDLTFNQLKQICRCSDGNMTTHTRKLINEEYVTVKKEFKNNKPLTTYHLTEKGRKEFVDYVNTLNELIKGEEQYEENFNINDCLFADNY